MARVLQVVTELVLGGASLTMLDFAEDLAEVHDVLIAHGPVEAPANAAVRRARSAFPTYELPRLGRDLEPRADVAALRSLVALCRHVRPDVLHTHSSKAGFIGRLGAPPSVEIRLHTVHGWGHTPNDTPLRRRMLIGAERVAARRTTRLIAVADEVRTEGLAHGIGTPEQYVVIGAPVDMRPAGGRDFAMGRAQARQRLDLPADAEVVGWVGRFSPQKDPDALVEVLSGLLSRRPGAHAVLVGDGPGRAAVEARLAPMIEARRVRLMGARADVRELYAAFDVLLHTSRWEGHPRVVREALAERVPVVTARTGGVDFIARDPRLGVEVPVGDVPAYRAALEAILSAPGRRAPVSDRALAELRAAADQPYRSMRELYATALAQRR